jgi:hypothetical protein
MRVFLVSAALAAMVCGCAEAPQPSASLSPCPIGGQRQTAELVFGRVSSDGPGVSEADFAHFLDEEVSPRFPDGLTIVDAQGRWTPPAGSAIHEPSKMVMIVLRGLPDDQPRLDAIRAAYGRRYHQQSVLLMTRSACVSF